MAQDYSKSRKMESQPLPENNPLYRFWMLREDPNGKVVKHSCFSYVNRNNPKKCYNYAKTIHLRIKDAGYIWLIDCIFLLKTATDYCQIDPLWIS